jgi:hypothetical protein
MRTLNLAVMAVALATSMNAGAALTMNITDAGGGKSRFVFSGSATVVSGIGGGVNGIWVSANQFGTPFMSGPSAFAKTVISGGGTITDSPGETGVVFDVYQDANFGFAPRDGETRYFPGTVLSWSGDLVAAIPFSNFIPGQYTTTTLMFGTIDSPYVLTIGAVPEPSTVVAGALLLLPFGASAMRVLRNRKSA